MTVRFACVTEIEAAPEVVFDLSLDIDAHVRSMAGSGERAIGGVTSGTIGLHEEVTWAAHHLGIPFVMTSRITELDRPRRFVDVQVHGPFHTFRHEHRFEATGGGTRMVDAIRFDAPLGVLGRTVERLVLATYLRRLIAKRNDYLKKAAEAAA